MAYEPLILQVDAEVVRAAERALRYRAKMEAGMSQAPDLFTKEETVEWAQAKALRAARLEAEREAKRNLRRVSILNSRLLT